MTKQVKTEEILLPSKSESAAITLKCKTAALCYDRIWWPSEKHAPSDAIVPKSIRCFGGTPGELVLIMPLDNEKIRTRQMEQLFQQLDGLEGLVTNLKKWLNEVGPSASVLEGESVFDSILRKIAKSFFNKHAIAMIPVYGSKNNRNHEYREGNHQTVVATLSNLEIVDEEQLTWKTVLDFRVDKEARQRYNRFLHWLDKEMVGKSQAFIEDEISQRLEDYERAIKKHGIKTVLGTVEEALDGKYLLGASGVAGSLTLAGHPTLGALAAGLLIGGKIGIKLIQTKLDFDDVERGPNSEISWVYEAKKLNK